MLCYFMLTVKEIPSIMRFIFPCIGVVDFEENFLHTVVRYQVFLSNTNNLNTVT